MSGSLYLHLQDPRADPPAPAGLVAALRDCGLIGEAIGNGQYRVGDQFAHRVVFAGCSPHLVFEPRESGSLAFCHVAVLGPYEQPRMLTGPHTLQPRCRHCGQRESDWRPLLAAWEAAPGEADWRCGQCGHAAPVDAWRWRRRAVFGRFFVAVREVFPAEAVPADALLEALRVAGNGSAWDYGWADTIA